MKIVLTAIACALLAASAQAAEIDATPNQNHNLCLNPSDINHLSFPDDKTILFHMNGGHVRVWQNDLPHACYGLKFQGGIGWVIRGGLICDHMQTFWVLRQGTTCMLGHFTPYVPPEKKG